MLEAKKNYELWKTALSGAERAELETLSEAEITDRFSAFLPFGTAGMRGTVGLGTYRMNLYTVRRATEGLAKWAESLGDEAKSRGVVVSCDTRRFSKEFSKAVAETLARHEIRAYLFEDVRPVPMCSFAVRYLNAVAGVMITASHNPKEYNGYKVYGADGAQMALEDTSKVVAFIDGVEDYLSLGGGELDAVETAGKDNEEVAPYVTVIGKTVDEAYYNEVLQCALSPNAVKEYGKDLKLVYTPIHGAGWKPVTEVLRRLGLNVAVVEEQKLPDTEFSTVKVPNPENSDTLELGMKLADETGADVVIGTDPDCDRMGIALRGKDGKFVLLNGNQIGVLLTDYILTRLRDENKLPENGAVIRTIVTTSMVDRIAKAFGVTVVEVLTGFKFIGEKIKEWEISGEHTYLFGFEESYGSLRGTHARDKDAVVASMLFTEMACYYCSVGKTVYERLSELFETYGYYVEKNVSVAYSGFNAMNDMAEALKKVREKSIGELGGEKVEFISDYLKGTKTVNGKTEALTLPKTDALYYGLKDGQFVCMRPSGTEPKLKLYVLANADGKAEAEEKAARMMEAAKAIL